jgi:hypothetical protein
MSVSGRVVNVAAEIYRLVDHAMLWIILFVATCALLGLAFVPDLSI